MSHHSPAPDARLVPLVLVLFFVMSAVGHYVFVVRDGHHAEPAVTHGSAQDAEKH